MKQKIQILSYIIKDEIKARFELIGRRFRLGDLLVVSGIITRNQLRTALNNQKETGLRLGDQLIADSAITKYVLKKFLFKQWAHRVSCAMAGVILGGFSVLFPPQVSQADNFNDIIIMAKADITSIDRQEYKKEKSRLFNRSYSRYGDLSAFTKWNTMLERLNRQVRQGANNKLMKEWKDDLTAYINYDFKEKVDAVNRYVNEVQYHSDKKVWGKTDFWATPFEFFKMGGDCEDYAITKMLSLQALGIPENRMRITIVHDLEKNIPHAVLVVYDQKGDAYILDNQAETVKKDTRVSNYKPIFSISRNSWWRYNT